MLTALPAAWPGLFWEVVKTKRPSFGEVQIPENGKYPSGLILSGSDGDGLVAADIDLGGIQDPNTDSSRTSGENKDDCDGQNHKNAFCFFHDNLVCLIAFHCQYMGCIEKTQLTSAGCDSIL